MKKLIAVLLATLLLVGCQNTTTFISDVSTDESVATSTVTAATTTTTTATTKKTAKKTTKRATKKATTAVKKTTTKKPVLVKTEAKTTAKSRPADKKAYEELKAAFAKTKARTAVNISIWTDFACVTPLYEFSLKSTTDILCENTKAKPYTKGSIVRTTFLDAKNRKDEAFCLEQYFDADGFVYEHGQFGETEEYGEEEKRKYFYQKNFWKESSLVQAALTRLYMPTLAEMPDIRKETYANGVYTTYTFTPPVGVLEKVSLSAIEDVLNIALNGGEIVSIAVADMQIQYYVDTSGYLERIDVLYTLVYEVEKNGRVREYYGPLRDLITFPGGGEEVIVDYPDLDSFPLVGSEVPAV